MQAYRVNTTIQEDGTLTVSHLPLQAGEVVEVIILVQPSTARPQDRYPLRGTEPTRRSARLMPGGQPPS
jgi:hypothetical protein